MERIEYKAYAKVNIGLDITGKKEDDYHLLRTVMQTVNLYDEIIVSRRPKGIMLRTDRPFLPNDERNLAFKAARFVSQKYKQVKGVDIEIKKHIPVGGGMAGGSTDAAAVIQALDRLFSLHMQQEEKDEIALGIGADVPFCLRKGIYYAEGVGEKLNKLKALPDMAVIICAPQFSVSTPWAYQAYDEEKEIEHPDMDALLSAIEAGDSAGIFRHMGNVLEPVVMKEHGQIADLIQLLKNSGADKALMSGSGSTVFGLFSDRKAAQTACDTVRKEANGAEVFLTDFVKG